MGYSNYRNEIKYICSSAQLLLIENRIRNLCCPDPNGGSDGAYLVTSLYFDDHEDSCYYENENGVDPREKFRIRIYNRDLSHILLECKQKHTGMTRKDSCVLDSEICASILQREPLLLKVSQEPLLNKFYILLQTKRLHPKVIVEYKRTAYIYRAGNVRITFDRNITVSNQISQFGQMDFCRPVMESGRQILEIKYDGFIPDYIYNAAGIDKLQHTAFSKYYICRGLVNV